MSNIETKTVDFKVKGKDGFVNTCTIQRHKPYFPMCFIRTVTGHMLFCQENHPVCIKTIDGQDTVVEAKDVVMFHDRIWVDNSNIEFDNRNYTDIISDLNDVENFNYTLKILIDIIENKEIQSTSKFISGDNIYNFCLNLENLVITRYEFDDIISYLLRYSNFQNKKIYSFNLVSQIKQLADKLNYVCVFDLYEDNGTIYWLLKTSYLYVSTLKQTQKLSDYVDIEQVISGIDGYQGYVYDLKTETEEFMNNNVQTHNSFHCLHKDSKVYILEAYNSYFKDYTLEELWNKYNDIPVEKTFNQNNQTQYEKDLSCEFIHTSDIKQIIHGHIYRGYMSDDDEWNSETDLGTTIVKKIIRHKQDPSTKMVKITTNDGKSLISQDNHPTFFIEPDGDIKEYEPKYLMENLDYTDYRCLNLKDNILSDYINNIEYVDNIPDGEYVYDLTTESERYFANDILTHNTGGAAEFKKINILKELKSSVPEEYESFFDRSFEQKENDLFSNVDLLKIVVNKNLYKDEYKIKREGDTYKLALGYFTMIVGENEIRSTIEMPVDLFITHDFSENENEIVVIYGKGDKIFNIKYFKIAPEEVAQKIDKLVAGKSPWETPEDLLKKLHDNLSQFGPYDMTHIEVILSNILRNKTDPMIPARLKEPYDPVTFSIKTLPSVLSWSLGIAFENFSKALTYGLISKDPGNLSSIEKVLYGEPLSDLSKSLLKGK